MNKTQKQGQNDNSSILGRVSINTRTRPSNALLLARVLGLDSAHPYFGRMTIMQVMKEKYKFHLSKIRHDHRAGNRSLVGAGMLGSNPTRIQMFLIQHTILVG